MKQQAKNWNVPNVFLDLNTFQGLTATLGWFSISTPTSNYRPRALSDKKATAKPLRAAF